MRDWRVTFAGAIAACLLTAPSAAARTQCSDPPETPVQYAVTAIGADRISPPATTPPIGVLDFGVSNVPELAGRLRRGYDATSGGTNTSDHDGHGTAVAAVAAARAGAVRGVSPTSPIVPIKVFDAQGDTRPQWVIRGIKKAVSLAAGVINISAAAERSASTPAIDRAVQNAVFEAVTRGVPVVAPSGNEGAAQLDIPAAYPHVIAVGATDDTGGRAPFSNRGAGLDLVAPGDGITTAVPAAVCRSGYALESGTSFAAPAVSGAIALLLARHPHLSVAQVAEMLRSEAAWNAELGFGLLKVPSVLDAPVPAADAPEVDDNVEWADRHAPVSVARGRSRTVVARVTARSDPADCFRTRVKRGDRLTAKLTAPSARLGLTLRTASRALVRRTNNRAAARAATSGWLYACVTAEQTPSAGGAYTLELKRTR